MSDGGIHEYEPVPSKKHQALGSDLGLTPSAVIPARRNWGQTQV
jgi:hypothetical protein